MRFIFTSVKHPNQYTCLLKWFLSPIDPVSSRVDSRLWSHRVRADDGFGSKFGYPTSTIPPVAAGVCSYIPPNS